MRKLQTIPMGIALLFTTHNLAAQTRHQNELAQQANNLFAADIDNFFAWFTAPGSKDLLLFLMGFLFFIF